PASGNGPLGQTSFGTAGAVEFDLGSLKAALQQSNLTSSAVRATFRLTPISSLNMLDFLSGPITQLPPTTQIVLLDMTQNQKNLVVDYQDFPGYTSPGTSNLEGLSATIANAPDAQRATVRTDLLGLLAPLSFDVTAAVQRDLQAS